MDRPVQTVRLIGVVLMSSVGVLFVHYYSQVLSNRMEVVFQATALPPACQFLSDYALVGIVLPLFAAVSGSLAIVKQRRILLEIVLALVFVLSVAWVLFPLVAWQIARIPVFSGMQTHY